MSHLFICLPLFLLSLCLDAKGQMVSKVGISTIGFGGAAETVCFKNEGRAETISVSNSALSASLSYSGTRGIVFFANEQDFNKGEPEYARVILPEGATRVLLAFGRVPAAVAVDGGEEEVAEDEPLVPLISAYGIDDEDFRPGSYRIFNRTPESLDLKLDEVTASVVPDAQVTLQSPEWTSKPGAVNFSVSRKADDKASAIFSSLWGHRPERRYMIFLLPSDERSRPIKAISVYDVP